MSRTYNRRTWSFRNHHSYKAQVAIELKCKDLRRELQSADLHSTLPSATVSSMATRKSTTSTPDLPLPLYRITELVGLTFRFRNCELDPNNPTPRAWMSETLNAKGRYADSLLIWEKNPTTHPNIAAAISYAKTGQREKAEDIINRLKELEKTRYVQNYWIALLHAALGDKDAAFAELEKAYQNHDWFLTRLKTDSFMDPLRDDPRSNDLLKRMGMLCRCGVRRLDAALNYLGSR